MGCVGFGDGTRSGTRSKTQTTPPTVGCPRDCPGDLSRPEVRESHGDCSGSVSLYPTRTSVPSGHSSSGVRPGVPWCPDLSPGREDETPVGSVPGVPPTRVPGSRSHPPLFSWKVGTGSGGSTNLRTGRSRGRVVSDYSGSPVTRVSGRDAAARTTDVADVAQGVDGTADGSVATYADRVARRGFRVLGVAPGTLEGRVAPTHAATRPVLLLTIQPPAPLVSVGVDAHVGAERRQDGPP